VDDPGFCGLGRALRVYRRRSEADHAALSPVDVFWNHGVLPQATELGENVQGQGGLVEVDVDVGRRFNANAARLGLLKDGDAMQDGSTA
jgi:hypothetical protein